MNDRSTSTRLCKHPDRVRERLPVERLVAFGSSSRDADGPWVSSVTARIDLDGAAMRLDLRPVDALGFGLDLVEGAMHGYVPDPRPTTVCERLRSSFPGVDELRLLALAARASTERSPEAEVDVAFLLDLCRRTAGQPEAGPWPEAGRHENDLADLQRAEP